MRPPGLVTVFVVLGAVAVSVDAGLGARLASAATALAVLVAGRLPRPGPRAIAGWRWANGLVLLGAVLIALAGGAWLAVGTGLVGWLQVHRAATRAGPGDDRVALLLALLHLLLACVLGLSAGLGLVLVVAAALAPLALLRVQEADAGAPAAPGLGAHRALPLVVLPLTAAFFFGLPRVQGGVGAGAAAASLSGFSEEVALGDLGPILDNPDVVLTATLQTEGGGPVPPGPYRFRALAHDHFDGLRWRHTIGLNPSPGAGGGALPPGAVVLHQDITLEPLTDGVLPGLVHARRLSAPGEVVQLDGNGNYRLRGVRGPVSYRVESVLLPDGVALPAGATPSSTGRAFNAALRAGVWTSLPPGLDPRIPALAEQLASEAGPSPRARADATVAWLEGNLAYTAVPMPGDARRPLADFLFDTRRGHCEYFATALVVLLRAQGVPARLVSGFYTSEVNTLGGFAVARQQDAHAWVEAWIADEGWVTLDATPAVPGRAEAPLPERVAQVLLAGWRSAVLDYDMGAQFSLVQRALSGRPGGPVRAGDGLRALLLAVLALAAMGAVRRAALAWSVRRRTAPGPVAAAWRRAVRRVEAAGWALPPGAPPVEAAEALVREVGAAALPLREIAWAWYAVRYGGAPEATVLAAVRAAEAALRGLPRRVEAVSAPAPGPGGGAPAP